MIWKTRKRLKKLALPKFSPAAQKIWVAQNLGGLQPPSPPGPYAYEQSLVIYDDFNTLRQSVLLKVFSSSSCLDCSAISDLSTIFSNKISNSVGLGFIPLARSLEKFSS